MAEVAPHTVLTFGPDGMTNHEGHKSVSRWATDAFHRHAPPGAHLYYAVQSTTWSEQFLPSLRDLGAFREGAEAPVLPDDEIDLDLVLTGDLLDLKVAAIREHESQVAGLIAAFGESDWSRAMARETFRLAASRPA
jgi:LmbE family N-acetylglucosaminyl deacetylase